MHTAWVRFATDGAPGWPAWDPTHPVRVFGTPDGPDDSHAPDGTRMAFGPYDPELALWDADARRPRRVQGAGTFVTSGGGPRPALRRFRRSP